MPSALVTVVCAPICTGLVAVTVTPGSTAPVLSVMVPLMLPVVCARAAPATVAQIASAKKTLRPTRTIPPPCGTCVPHPTLLQPENKQPTSDGYDESRTPKGKEISDVGP